jgi:hypothetical protein
MPAFSHAFPEDYVTAHFANVAESCLDEFTCLLHCSADARVARVYGEKKKEADLQGMSPRFSKYKPIYRISDIDEPQRGEIPKVRAMIVLEQKPLQEILEMTRDFDSLLIIGCDGCAGIYQVGGEKQAEVMKTLLEMGRKIKEGKDLKARATTVLRQCDLHIVASSLRPLVEDHQAILSLACGAGVQTLASAFPSKTIIPSNDTKFIGAKDRELGRFYELCRACGDCLLYETGGVCPLTRCAKGLLNGPCGGQSRGKCEVGGWKKDCAWIQIYNRLRDTGKLDRFTMFRPPRDFRVSQPPREIGPIQEVKP